MKTNNSILNTVGRFFGWMFGRKEKPKNIVSATEQDKIIEDHNQSAFHPAYIFGRFGGMSIPEIKRRKFKGWQRENLRSTFNKNR
jgi:hypothetical protein